MELRWSDIWSLTVQFIFAIDQLASPVDCQILLLLHSSIYGVPVIYMCKAVMTSMSAVKALNSFQCFVRVLWWGEMYPKSLGFWSSDINKYWCQIFKASSSPFCIMLYKIVFWESRLSSICWMLQIWSIFSRGLPAGILLRYSCNQLFCVAHCVQFSNNALQFVDSFSPSDLLQSQHRAFDYF